MGIYNTLRFITNHPLTRDKKISALLRFANWQIKSRFSTKNFITVPFAGDAKLLIKRGMTGATGNIYVGLQEFEDMAFTAHFLRDTDLFVDIGANIGSYTILAGTFSGCSVVSIEPIPSTFEYLVNNLKLNGLEEQVEAVNLGVGSKDEKLLFSIEQDTVNHVISSDTYYKGETKKIAVISLTSVLKGRNPALIKIDVEGYEAEIVRGGKDILNKETLSAVILELNGSGKIYGYDDEKVHEEMLSMGFSSYRYDPFQRELVDLNNSHSNTGNTLYIRNVDKVKKLLKNAPMLQVLKDKI